MKYNFLILSLLFLVPGMFIYCRRKDLRGVIHVMALFSIPFAFTERFFYPSYWEPVFLFDLVNKIGFGIEDLIFVIGLSAFTSTVYAFSMGYNYITKSETDFLSVFIKGLLILGTTFLLVITVVLLKIEMIFGSFGIMTGMSLVIFFIRKDLIIPGLAGGILSVTIYSLLCFCLMFLIPDIFKLTWHTDQFMNYFIFGIPIEEIIYGYTSGMISTIFYPFVFSFISCFLTNI